MFEARSLSVIRWRQSWPKPPHDLPGCAKAPSLRRCFSSRYASPAAAASAWPLARAQQHLKGPLATAAAVKKPIRPFAAPLAEAVAAAEVASRAISALLLGTAQRAAASLLAEHSLPQAVFVPRLVVAALLRLEGAPPALRRLHPPPASTELGRVSNSAARRQRGEVAAALL